MTTRASRSARPPGLDWEDSFYSLDERYRQLQRQLNEKDEELKRWKVAARRASAAPPATSAGPQSTNRASARPSLTATERQSGGMPRPGTALSSSTARDNHRVNRSFVWPPGEDVAANDTPRSPPVWPSSHSRQAPAPASRLYAEERPHTALHAADGELDTSTSVYVGVPSRAQPDAARAAAMTEASMWGPDAMLPDPSLIWGAEGSIQNYVAASALYHANEELRRKLTEATTTIQSQQQELSATRTLLTNMQAKTEDVTQQMHQLVRERDLATQKLSSAKLTNTDLEKALQNHVSEQEKICFGLEAQVTELRSRLVVGTDSNEQLSRDVRMLLNEAREKSAEAMTLRSKLALVESALSSQKHTNENLLVELKSLNHQLVDERKRMLSLSRAVQLSGLDQDRIASLQDQLQRVKSERDDCEREHVRLMSEFVRITEGALQQAREEVRVDLQDWREAAAHWEEVAQLLYKDIAERTQTHARCRAECEEAKAMRDAYNMELKNTRAELTLCRAKLDVVWPGHAADTQNLSAEDIRAAFGKQHRVPFMQMVMRGQRKRRAPKGKEPKSATGVEDATAAEGAHAESNTANQLTARHTEDVPLAIDKDGAVRSDQDETGHADALSSLSSSRYDEDEALWMLPLGGDGDAADQVRELHEANLMLLADLQQLRASNELLQSRVEMTVSQFKSEKQTLKAEAETLGSREAASQRLLERQLDRVAFLESQVRSLRGYPVESGAPLDSLATSENELELFLGQLVSTCAPVNTGASDTATAGAMTAPSTALLFDRFFCSADFLVHEAVVTPTITGLNGFFDTTASFRIAMDALLLYYLQTRDLIVQLHRVRSDEEVQAELQKEEETARRARHQKASRHGSEGQHNEPRAGSEKSASDSQTTHTTTGSSERMAARLYETVAEGRVSLLDLVLDERTRQSPRPTYKGHVRLSTPQGEHLASLEFHITARASFPEEFQTLVTKTFADMDVTALRATRTANTAQDRKGNDVRRDRHATKGARDSLHAWMLSTSSTASSSTPLLPQESTRHTPARHRGSGSRGAQAGASGLKLYPSSQAAQELARGWASSASYTSSASSMINGSAMTPWETSGGPPHRSLLRSTRAAAPAPPPPQSHQSQPHQDASLQSQHDAPGSFMHVPAQQADAMSHIQSMCAEIERVELSGDMGLARPPRLSCLYLLPAVGQDVRLLAPPTPRYTTEYANAKNTVNVLSLSQLSALTHEPLTVFLVDEDAPAAGDSNAIYALAVCEWSRALEHVNVPQQFRLPLLRRGTYETIPGATLVITLTALSVPTAPNAAIDPPATTGNSTAVTPPAYPSPADAQTPFYLSTASRVAPQMTGQSGSLLGSLPPTQQQAQPPATMQPAVQSIEEAMMQLDWQRMH